MIAAVLFDLDDTLFEQRHWLAGAWQAVAAEAARRGADREAVHRALVEVAREGSGRGRIVDRALELAGARVAVKPLVDTFRAYRPARLPLRPGAREALDALRARVPIGLVTDGDPGIQRSKLRALGLVACFDVAVFSDELGRRHRKPDPLPFLTAVDALRVPRQHVVYVGDRPDKDVAGAALSGLRAVRVLTGEYAHVRNNPQPWATASDVVGAVELVLAECQPEPLGPLAATSRISDNRLALYS